ncbi:MAG: phospholipase D-like domain-containing protein [Xanthomonadales bacterium]|nr:phospholipase D-like domain-containing protein [Xanthomonadales bacterium]
MAELLGDISWQWLVAGLQVIIAPLAAGHAIVRKRDPRSALGWVGLILVFPLVGPVLYFLFGINRVQTRARQLTEVRGRAAVAETPGALSRVAVTGPLGQMARVSDSISHRPLLAGNHAVMLCNGNEAYPDMLDSIRSARRSIFLMSYIMNVDPVGQRFVDALADAVKRGLEVKVLIDGMGERYSRRRMSRVLRRRGVRAEIFLPPRLIPPSLHINLRNHRKVLVTDWNTAYTGGMNIAQRHLAEQGERSTRDLQFRFTGPVVSQIYEIFAASWHFATGEAMNPKIPLPDPTGEMVCRALSDGPDDEIDILSQILLGLVAAARRRVQILTPYFLPSRELIGALQGAALRGIEVQIVLPSRSNLPYMDWATRKMLWEIVQRGVAVYYQSGSFDHSKLLVVDGQYVQLGSANIDPRSLRLNFESAVEVFDQAFAARCEAHIDGLVAASRRVSLEELEGRSLPVRLRDGFFWLFSPYL